MGSRFRTAYGRERCEIDRLAGNHPLRAMARGVQRCAAWLVALTCLLGVLGGVLAVRALQHAASDDVSLMVAVCLGIAIVALAVSLICMEALGRVAERLRRESWQAEWAQWSPVMSDREGL
jgi:protein-S-isoprenylcysteine O-methyltransferase Ste14